MSKAENIRYEDIRQTRLEKFINWRESHISDQQFTLVLSFLWDYWLL